MIDNNEISDEKEYFSIGEVSEILHLKDYVIRFWEKKFRQLSPLISEKGKRRKYTHDDIYLIAKIQDLLYNKGFTLAGAQRYLDENKGKIPPPQHLIHPVKTKVSTAHYESSSSVPTHKKDSSGSMKKSVWNSDKRQHCVTKLKHILQQLEQLSMDE